MMDSAANLLSFSFRNEKNRAMKRRHCCGDSNKFQIKKNSTEGGGGGGGGGGPAAKCGPSRRDVQRRFTERKNGTAPFNGRKFEDKKNLCCLPASTLGNCFTSTGSFSFN